jgi:hypothetical protein
MKMLTEEKVVKIDQKIEEVENEGLISLMGQTVTLFCVNYIYAGKLVGVNKTCVKLENPHVVYETGDFNTHSFKDAQRIGKFWYVRESAVESFGLLKDLK